jgi:hypothetical protein
MTPLRVLLFTIRQGRVLSLPLFYLGGIIMAAALYEYNPRDDIHWFYHHSDLVADTALVKNPTLKAAALDVHPIVVYHSNGTSWLNMKTGAVAT